MDQVQFITTTAKCMALTDDLKVQGPMILNVILSISSNITEDLILFLMFMGKVMHLNSCQMRDLNK